MNEEFIENLKDIYKKATKKNLLSVALKSQEMIARYYGYFSKNTKKDISMLNHNELSEILGEIKKMIGDN
ncbi:hypothetical protein FZC35_01765 [Candidatus Cytomitobacter indipagum]|uniref:Uncharacterized protein n=1 Tax=Candidatus Cytomitobacter indipagum TaxID=2601575 RepID=A0A5C0UDI1_9PROT|nr:hypothetical protein [Candidatus Cytomitobacter indipagum]QEK38096.1 hypothetical protein FZC35_01765 [Candidatus Cytomitobacter indipagum]